MIKCIKCNQEKEPHAPGAAVCVDCHKADVNRKALQKRKNEDWMVLAEESEIELFERQPEETDVEWSLWCAYRDMYPATKPNIRVACQDLDISYGHARRISSRWDYSVRIKAWAKHCDELVMKHRQDAIVDMNMKHINMAEKLRKKLDTAIDNLDPYAMDARDINSLMKTMAEVERKAYGDDTQPYAANVGLTANKQVKDSTTKKEDLPEVLSILMSAGMLDSKKIGIEQTTRVVVQEEDDAKEV